MSAGGGAGVRALCAAAAAVGLMLPAAVLAQSGQPGGVAVRAANPLPVARRDEALALDWATLRARLAGVAADRVRVIDAGTGEELPSQVLDENGDGQPEQLLVLASFWPDEVKQLRVEAAPPTSQPKPRAYAKHDAHRDDVAWETDRIAFRIYGQGLWQAAEFQPLVSSGIDVWPKRVRDLIIDRWYEKGHDAYHIDTGEGADFYTVGPTLGAGGSAVWRNGTLHRARNFKSHRIIATGPIRLIFELTYEPWDAAGLQVSEVKRITMDAGQHLFRQDITYQLAGAGAPETPYALGTVKREGLVGTTSRAGPWAWLSTWGPVERRNGGHGSLGTAVLIERSRVLETKETDDHYLMIAAAQAGRTTTQYVGAAWTASGDFPDVESWWRHLDAFGQRLERPIEITIR